EQSVDLRLDLGYVHYVAGELGKRFPSLREAERLAQTLGDQRRLGWVWAVMGQHLLVTHDSNQARLYAQRARDIGASCGDVNLTATANYYLGWACHVAGDFGDAENFLRKSLQGMAVSLERSLNSASARHKMHVFGSFGGYFIVRRQVAVGWSLAVSV